MKNTKVIGFLGKKGVGKNYVANVVSRVISGEEGPGSVEQGALADPIKDFLSSVLEVEDSWLRGTDAEKNTLTKYYWEGLPEYIREANLGKVGSMTARELMQVFGTEVCRRCFGDDVWTRALRRRIDRSRASWFLVTDVRFPNELEAIKEWGGQVWRVVGPQRIEGSVVHDNHPSETMSEKCLAVDRCLENFPESPLDELEAEILGWFFAYKSVHF